MPPTETESLRADIDHNSRIRDATPELIPTALARELVNHYPADVNRSSHRLASLAGELLQRERANTTEERSLRLLEVAQMRAHIRKLEAELAQEKERSASLETAATEAAALRARLHAIGGRVRAFGRSRRVSKKAMVGQVLALAKLD
jgi:hypothetical protein